MFRLGLIGGTGLDHWGEPLETHSVDTPFGAPSGPIGRFQVGATEILFLPRHGTAHDIAPHRVNYRANIGALAGLDAQAIVAVNAVGGVDPALRPGALVVPDQLIDYTYGRQQTFFDGEAGPLEHVEFADPFTPALRRALLAAGSDAGIPVHEGGCLAVTQGPRLETTAEIQRLARDGNALVGMTTMPEAALAREAGLPYACLAVVANPAAGLAEPITQDAIEATLADAMNHARRVIGALTDTLA